MAPPRGKHSIRYKIWICWNRIQDHLYCGSILDFQLSDCNPEELFILKIVRQKQILGYLI